MTVPITVERRDRDWWVLYAGTVLFIGAKREAVAVAQECCEDVGGGDRDCLLRCNATL